MQKNEAGSNRADKFYKHLLQIIASLENYMYYYLHGVDAGMRFQS